MKRIITVLSVVLLILVGCTEMEEPDTKSIEKKSPDVKTEEAIKKLTSDLTKFHFVVDWLSNKEILFVEKDKNVYFLKSFNITTGDITVLYEDSSIIVDVLVHPSKEKLLIHITDNPKFGIVKVISLDGVVEHELTIESSELEIEWNDMEPSFILFTAFYEDWTYDVFLYDGLENDLRLFPLENPFPKWLGNEKIVASNVSNHTSDGAGLYLYDRISGQRKLVEESGIIHYDTYQQSLLLIQINEDEKALYTILDQDLSVHSTWIMPAMSNGLDWLIPESDWLTSEEIILVSAKSELEEAYELVKAPGDDGERILVEEVTAGLVRCSPNAKMCLTGYTFETLIDLKNQEKIAWLVITD